MRLSIGGSAVVPCSLIGVLADAGVQPAVRSFVLIPTPRSSRAAGGPRTNRTWLPPGESATMRTVPERPPVFDGCTPLHSRRQRRRDGAPVLHNCSPRRPLTVAPRRTGVRLTPPNGCATLFSVPSKKPAGTEAALFPAFLGEWPWGALTGVLLTMRGCWVAAGSRCRAQ
jgi:hypothetical protein